MELERGLSLSPDVAVYRLKGGIYAFHPPTRTCISMNEAMLDWLEHPDAGSRTAAELYRLGILVAPRTGQDASPRSAPLKPPPPTCLAIFVTTRCNLRCAYCYANGGDFGKTIAPQIWRTAMGHFFDAQAACGQRFPRTVTLVIHGGGEPTLEFGLLKDLVAEFKARAKAAGLRATISMGSNGAYPEPVHRWILDNDVHVNISLDGPPHVQDRLRPLRSGLSSFDAVARNLQALVQAGRKMAVRSTVTAETLDSMPATVELAHEMGIATVHFEPVSITGRCNASGVARPPADEFAERFLQCFLRGLALDVAVRYSGMRCFGACHKKFCAACGDNFCVTVDGNITMCYEVLDSCHPAAESFFVGKVDSVHGTVDVDSQHIATLGKRTAENMEACSNCFLRLQCAGDCPLKSYQYSGCDLYSPDPYRCQIAHAVNRQLIAWLADGVIVTRNPRNSLFVSLSDDNRERISTP